MDVEYIIFCVRDIWVGFNQPWCDVSEAVAKRGFEYTMNHGDITKAYPADFQLYKLGTYNPKTGKITALDIPEFICDGTEVIGND